MDLILSSLLGGGETVASEATSTEVSGTSRVIAFHSSHCWQLHFNSSNQLNKL
ncbi:thioredoxin H2, partial [Olea europaea subsp. europaea]